MTKTKLLQKVKNLNMQKHAKYIFTTLLIGLFFVIASPQNTTAQTDPGLTGAGHVGFIPSLGEALNGAIVGTVGCTTNNPKPALDIWLLTEETCVDKDGGVVVQRQGGAIAALFEVNDKMYQSPPSSSIIWAYDQYQQFQDKELLTTVYAQDPNDTDFYFPGLGYNLLTPVLSLWQWSRNLVYTIYIVIIIVIAFLILFRQSLGGSTVVTLVNSLPSLIISLVLVTLSYPIAGVFVDFIYIGTNLLQNSLITGTSAPGNELQSTELIPVKEDPLNPGRNPDSFYIQPDDPEISIWAIWGSSGSDIVTCELQFDDVTGDPIFNTPGDPNSGQVESCANNLIPNIEDSAILKYVGSITQGSLGAGANILGNSALLSGGNFLLSLVLALAAFMSAIKLFFALLRAYLTLTLSPIYLPWMFLWTAFPSKTKSGIISALKPLAAASCTFICVYGLFLLMIIFGQSDNFTGAFKDAGQFQFVPPLLGYGSQFQTDSSIVKSLLVYMLFMVAPTIPDMVNSLLNVQSGGQTAQKIGQSTAQAGGRLLGFTGQVLNLPGSAKKK